MKKLSLGTRLFLTNLLYIVPIIVLTYMMYDARNNDIEFAKLEVIGNEYESPLISFLTHVSQHRILAQRATNGMSEVRSSLKDLQTKIDEDLKHIAEADKAHGISLKFTDVELAKRSEQDFKYSKLASQWDEIKSKINSYKPKESNEAHSSLIANVRGMIVHMGNSSNLILDPDLDTYYLTDATLGGIPQIQDRLQEILVYTEPFIRTGKMTHSDRAQFLIYATLLQSDLDRISGDIKTALQEDENFHGKSETFQKLVPPAIQEFVELAGRIIAHLKTLGNDKSVKLEDFLSQSEKALDLGLKLWNIAETEDSNLLEVRISDFKKIRMQYLMFGILVLMVANIASFIVGKNLRKSLMDSLTSAVSELSQTATQTTITSDQILTNSEKMSSAATQQAAALQETVSALSEINAMVGKSTDNAVQSVEVVQQSQKIAIQGKKTVDNMIHAISEISQSNEEILNQTELSNRKIEDIVKVINEIATKTKVINDIVFQTKLLSFNASVEAARAGEHGKGFAVVAEEVGNLAQMSGNAAKEISEMLGTSTQTVASIVAETKTKISSLIAQGKVKIEDGKQTAESCGTVLSEIVTSVEQVTNRVNEIATAAAEQARGVDEITKAMHQLDEITQSNAQMSGESSSHATYLSSQAQKLTGVVRKIETAVFGRALDHNEHSAESAMEETHSEDHSQDTKVA